MSNTLEPLDVLCAKLADLPAGPEQVADLILAIKAYAVEEYRRGYDNALDTLERGLRP